MESRPRLIATDLDGTLVRSDGTISGYTGQVLRRAEQLGVMVVFVTGRPLRWAEEVFSLVGAHGLAIVSNGALVWDVAGDRADLVRPIAPEVVVDVANDLRAAIPRTSFAVETPRGIDLEPDFRERFPVPDGTRRGALETLVGPGVVKLLGRHEELSGEEFLQRALPAAAGRVEVTCSSDVPLLEISAAGVTKATTLALLGERYGIAAADVVAFGDMPNDTAMLEWAGRSYAMAGAHPDAIAAADHVALGNDEDGVAHAVAELLA